MANYPNPPGFCFNPPPLPNKLDDTLTYHELVHKIYQYCQYLLALEKWLDKELHDYTDAMRDYVLDQLKQAKEYLEDLTAKMRQEQLDYTDAMHQDLLDRLEKMRQEILRLTAELEQELKDYTDAASAAERAQLAADEAEVRQRAEGIKQGVIDDNNAMNSLIRELVEDMNNTVQPLIDALEPTVTRLETELPQEIQTVRDKFTETINNYKKTLDSKMTQMLNDAWYDASTQTITIKTPPTTEGG